MSAIPKEKRRELATHTENETVRVIILTPEQQKDVLIAPRQNLGQDAKDKGYDSFIDYLIDHPVRIPNMTYLTREEANAR